MELVIAAIGSMIAPAALGVSASTVMALGMTAGQLGWMAGSIVGTMLFSDQGGSAPPGLSDLKVSGSSYGAPIPFLMGTDRMGGQIIWASDKSTTRSATGAAAPPVAGESPPPTYGEIGGGGNGGTSFAGYGDLGSLSEGGSGFGGSGGYGTDGSSSDGAGFGGDL